MRNIVTNPIRLFPDLTPLAIYSETPQRQQILTITKQVTKMQETWDGSIMLFGEDGKVRAVLADHTKNPNPQLINLAQLAREAADRQGITLHPDID